MPHLSDSTAREAAARDRISTHLDPGWQDRFARYITQKTGVNAIEYFVTLISLSKKNGHSEDYIRQHMDEVLGPDSASVTENSNGLAGSCMKRIVEAYREKHPQPGNLTTKKRATPSRAQMGASMSRKRARFSIDPAETPTTTPSRASSGRRISSVAFPVSNIESHAPMMAEISTMVSNVTAAFNTSLPLVTAHVEQAKASLWDNQRELDASLHALDEAKEDLRLICSRLDSAGHSVDTALNEAKQKADERRKALADLEAVLPRLAHKAEFTELLHREKEAVQAAQDEVVRYEREKAERSNLSRQRVHAQELVDAQKKRADEAARVVQEQTSVLSELNIRLEGTRFWGALIRAGPKMMVFEEQELELGGDVVDEGGEPWRCERAEEGNIDPELESIIVSQGNGD